MSGLAIGIKGYKRIIGFVAFIFILLRQIFAPHFHMHFHGRVEGTGYFGFNMHYIAQLDRITSYNVCYTKLLRGSCIIPNPVHAAIRVAGITIEIYVLID